MLGIGRATLFRWEAEGLLGKVPRDLNNNRHYSWKHITTLLANLDEVQSLRIRNHIEWTLYLLDKERAEKRKRLNAVKRLLK